MRAFPKDANRLANFNSTSTLWSGGRRPPMLDRNSRAGLGLDAVNFFLADVRDGLGPYLAIYLLTIQKWDEASIGLVMSVTTVAGILAQTPAGARKDSTKGRRTVMIAAAFLVTAASLLLPWLSSFFSVAASQATARAASAVF